MIWKTLNSSYIPINLQMKRYLTQDVRKVRQVSDQLNENPLINSSYEENCNLTEEMACLILTGMVIDRHFDV